MGPKKKSQKKFERKHLSGEIVRRKHAKVAAQRRRAKEMRLAASMKDDEEGEESDEEGAEGFTETIAEFNKNVPEDLITYLA